MLLFLKSTAREDKKKKIERDTSNCIIQGTFWNGFETKTIFQPDSQQWWFLARELFKVQEKLGIYSPVISEDEKLLVLLKPNPSHRKVLDFVQLRHTFDTFESSPTDN